MTFFSYSTNDKSKYRKRNIKYERTHIQIIEKKIRQKYYTGTEYINHSDFNIVA